MTFEIRPEIQGDKPENIWGRAFEQRTSKFKGPGPGIGCVLFVTGRKEARSSRSGRGRKQGQCSRRDGRGLGHGGLLDPVEDFGFYPTCDGRPMRGFKQGLHRSNDDFFLPHRLLDLWLCSCWSSDNDLAKVIAFSSLPPMAFGPIILSLLP